MAFLIYSLIGLSIFKLIIDAIGQNLIAMYSVLLENIIFAILFAIILRTSIKQKLAPKESLIKKIEKLKDQDKKV